MQQLTGDYPAAETSHLQALTLYRDLAGGRNRPRCSTASENCRPGAQTARRPADYHDQALAIARDVGAPLEEARALEGIGRCYLQDGHDQEGTTHLQQALTIYQRIGAPGARRVQQALPDHHVTTA